jgi:hypothetical protein
MKRKREPLNVNSIGQRAARVRAGWTITERLQRRGLPPDTPRGMHRLLSGAPLAAWQNLTAAGAGWQQMPVAVQWP